MHLVIEASNIRKGGGLTHLQEVLRAADLDHFGIDKITIWGPQQTLDQIGESKRFVLRAHPWIDKGGVWTFWFRKILLDRLLDSSVDLLWAPGGTYTGRFQPYVTMVQNFLPFDKIERGRFRYSSTWLRFLLLEKLQLRSFKHAKGLIHISKKCDEVINRLVDLTHVKQTLIYHGINTRFFHEPRAQREFNSFTEDDPAKLLYVSTIDLYKHQDKLIQAAAILREKIPVRLDLVGSAYPPALRNVERLADRLDPYRKWIHLHGEATYRDIEKFYQNADLYACLSSCETFGMILLEAMASGLPILCSNRSALPEIHAGACCSVDPENVESISKELEVLLRSRESRASYAFRAFQRARDFSWTKCAYETFSFLRNVYESSPKKS